MGLDDAPSLRERLLESGRRHGLLGTVLLATEGINFCVAATRPGLDAFLDDLRADTRFAALDVKLSRSAAQPFRKLVVKVKREIIRMNHPGIQPGQGRAPAIDARTLKRWLDQGHDDQGQPVVTLDTRNGFEVDQGSFEGTIDWRLAKFSDFPQALQANKGELQGKTVVSFCTGGIRCEKAALYMREAGVQDVWQLEGGILKYFEETGGEHFRGACFVFDERETLGPDLQARREQPPTIRTHPHADGLS